MPEINSEILYKAIKKLCEKANTILPKDEYMALKNLYKNEDNELAKNALSQVLQNVKIAKDNNRPLCQDTGFVTVFLEIGQDVKIVGDNINDVINKAVGDAYCEYYYRKSLVSDVTDKRINTENNTSVLIHTDFVCGDKITITVSVKGGGCENISAVKMLTPAQGIKGIKDFVFQTIKNAGAKPCPPIRIGLGIGSNFEGAAILSKKALLKPLSETDLPELAKELYEEINSLGIGAMGFGGKSTCFGVNIMEKPCHIASLPVAISVSCHSSRHATAEIVENEIFYADEQYDVEDIIGINNAVEEIFVDEIEKIKSLQKGRQILLSGKIYTARDAAHKKLMELLKADLPLPIEIKNSIIFYAGPCPANTNEVIGPIGPTTSSRMDIYTPELYKLGLLATIGKGERSKEVYEVMQQTSGKYFVVTGGVASLLKSCVKSSEIIAYPELGAEAIYELNVEK